MEPEATEGTSLGGGRCLLEPLQREALEIQGALLIQRDVKIKQHLMNGWEMSPSKHGKGFPPDESNGKGRGKQSWSEGEGSTEGGEERKKEEEWEGGSNVSEFTKKGGNGVEDRKEKWKSLQPLRKAARETGWGENVTELTAGVEAQSLFIQKEAQFGHLGSIRNPQGWEMLTSGCSARPPPPRRQAWEGLCLVPSRSALVILKFFLIFKPGALIFILQQQIM